MVRAAAVFRAILCACALGAALPAAAQNTASFSPDRASYEQLGGQEKPQALPATYGLVSERERAQPASRRQVLDAIWSAAQHSGVDYNYLLAQAHLESGLNPNAKARTSSAAGLFQFIEGTWLASLDRYQGQLEGQLTEISGRSRSERLQWRHDAKLASFVAAAYAQENGKRLERVLGRPARSTELYLAHFLGGGGATRFMQAWKSNPHAAAAHFFPKAARANRPVFFTRSGRARSLQGVLSHFEGKIARALALFDIEAAGGKNDVKAFQLTSEDQITNSSAIGENLSPKLNASTAQQRSFATWEVLAAEGSLDAPLHLSKSVIDQDTIGLHSELILGSSSGLNAGLNGRRIGISTAANERTAGARGRIPDVAVRHCNHIEMCYLSRMSTSTITQVRDLIESGAYTKAGIARAAGLHANTLRDASEAEWNPTSDTLAKLQRFLDANDDRPVLVGAEEIIDEARNGRMYILVDDEDRENEGDLIIPAQMATPAAVNFMATHGRGLICLALDKARVDDLGLDPMSRNNRESMQTAFTVSIEAKDGVTTGISAADRARTVAVAIDATKGPDDIVTPGHVFPLVAREGGTLVRAGHTEAAVDISRLAGLNPSGVICEIMNEDGSMARLDDLIDFARKHDMKIGTIRDLIAYRMRNDHLVERIGESSFESDYGGQWRMITYRNTISDNEAYVLQKGHISPDEPTLARVHPISVFDDVLGAPGPRKRTLQRAMGAIGEKGAGVIVILTQRVGTSGKWTADEEHRNIGIGSQILADLGVHEMVLLSNSRPDLVALEGYGITLTGHQEIPD